jgi:hypothetical protein
MRLDPSCRQVQVGGGFDLEVGDLVVKFLDELTCDNFGERHESGLRV